VDFALDFMMPGLHVSQRDNFVMHSRTTRMAHADISEYREGGRSSRDHGSVTVGKNPNRQVIIYDKRAEVLKKGNSHWPSGMECKPRKKQGLPPIDLNDRETSQIWRVELRAYKRHLKEDWGVATWWQLQQKLPEIFNRLLADIRYTSQANAGFEPALDGRTIPCGPSVRC
jgi:hypothetical protein